jgi:hypothetical protein
VELVSGVSADPIVAVVLATPGRKKVTAVEDGRVSTAVILSPGIFPVAMKPEAR